VITISRDGPRRAASTQCPAASVVVCVSGCAALRPAMRAKSVTSTPGAGTPALVRRVPDSVNAEFAQPRRTPRTSFRVAASSSTA
jgi:hypothetical protein